jgi:hypothetical protein
MNKSKPRERQIYGNCKVLHPNGKLMFLCLPKRVNWYLDRNLAEIINEDPLTIRLTFSPNGGGHIDDEYHLGEKRNACVVCNCDDLEYLTKHHIIPREYRKWFPLELKSRSSHDVVVLCSICHSNYEHQFADKLKSGLEKEVGINNNNTMRQDQQKTLTVYNYAKLMMDADRVLKIPEGRIDYFLKEMKRIFKTENPAEIYELPVHQMIRDELDAVAKTIIEGKDLKEFIKMWRNHFIESMDPPYMPNGWSIDYNC